MIAFALALFLQAAQADPPPPDPEIERVPASHDRKVNRRPLRPEDPGQRVGHAQPPRRCATDPDDPVADVRDIRTGRCVVASNRQLERRAVVQ